MSYHASLKECVEMGFSFGNINVSQSLLNILKNFEEYECGCSESNTGKIIKLKINKDDKNNIKNLILSALPNTQELFKARVPSMDLHVHTSIKNSEFLEHPAFGGGGICQFVLWVYEGNLEGREFYYGKSGNHKNHKIKSGDYCFIDVLNPEYTHGVRKQLSKNKVYSVLMYE